MNKKVEINYSNLSIKKRKKLKKFLKKKKLLFEKSLDSQDDYIVQIRPAQRSIIKKKKEKSMINISITDSEEERIKEEETIRMKRAVSRPIKPERAIFKKKEVDLYKSIALSDDQDNFERIYEMLKNNYYPKKMIRDFGYENSSVKNSPYFKNTKSFKSIKKKKSKTNPKIKKFKIEKKFLGKNLLKDSFFVGSLKLKNLQKSSDMNVLVKGSKFTAITQYKNFFPKLNFNQILVSPKLLPRKSLMFKIEILYNKVVEKILKTKKANINLSETIYELYCKKYKKNSSAFMQNLMNLLYSAEKYLKYFYEIDIFLQIVKKKASIGKIVLYLYIRQIFKFITFNYFQSEKKIKKNPLDIFLNRKICKNIFDQGFGFDKEFKDFMILKFNEDLNDKKNISYYDLMVFLWKKEKFSSVK